MACATIEPVTARPRSSRAITPTRLVSRRDRHRIVLPAFAAWIALIITAAALSATIASRDAARGPMAPAQATLTTPAAAAYLPLALHASLNQAIQTAAAARTATARAAGTQTARATGTVRPSPSPTPAGGTPGTPSPTSTGGSAQPASPTALTPTASLSPTATPSRTTTPTATGPTPTPTASFTPSITPTPRKDPAGERLVPAAALRSGENSVTYDTAARVYRLSHRGDHTVTYELDLRHPDNTRGRLTIRETSSGRFPVAGAGLFYRQVDGTLIEPRLFSLVGTVDAVEHAPLPAGDGVALTVRETLEGQPHAKRYTLRLVGAAIELSAANLDAGGVAAGAAGYAGFSAGQVEGSSDFVSVRLPYMDAVPVTMLDHRWFASTLVDYPRSQAGALLVRGPEAAPDSFINEVAPIYEPDAAGRIRPVDETVWVTLSPKVADTFALPDQPPSPHRPALAGPVHVTLAGGAPDVSFAEEAAYVELIKGWRVSDVLFHKPDWQPADVQRPAQGPPDPAAGDAAGFAALATAAGGRLAPSLAYTLTVTGCPGQANPLYRPADRVGGADGVPKGIGAGACPGGGESQAYLLATDAARRLVGEAAGDLSGRGVRAVDLAVLPAWNPAYPWPGAPANVLDQAAAPAHPATIGAAIGATKGLFAALQTGIGPVFGPGAFGTWETGYDSFYAGYVDGLARSLSSGSIDAPAGAAYLVVPDYELAVVRPRMIGYGMGDYRQFFADRAEDAPGTVRPLSEAEIDEWQATTLAYGHAGAWTARGALPGDGGDPDFLSPAEQVKSYFIMHALQTRYLDAPLRSVGYIGADGSEHDLDWALAHNYNLAGPRLHLVFGGGAGGGAAEGDGIELWLNHSPDVWTVTVGGSYSLPQHGWLARGEGGLLGYSALIEGHQADYLQAPDVTVLDGRGRLTDFGGLVARDLVVRFADGWRLEEQGDGRLEWVGAQAAR